MQLFCPPNFVPQMMETSLDVIHVYVSAKKFTLQTIDILAYPDSLLAKTITANEKEESLTFWRPISPFKAVVTLYQTGELHMPPNICPKEFEKEIQFWGFDMNLLESCCYLVYNKFLDVHSKMLDFQREFTYTSPAVHGADTTKTKLWMILDNRSSSFHAKVYLAVVIFCVIMSILVLCLSTMPQLMESPSKNELRAFITSAGHGDHVDDILGEMEENDADDSEIVTNITDTEARKRLYSKNVISKLKLFSLKKKWQLLVAFDYVLVTFFSVELIVRLMTCPNLCKYFRSVLNVIDALILVLAYIEIIVNKMNDLEKFHPKGIEILLYFQMLRIFRVIRIVKNVKAIQVLGYSFKTSYKDFLVMLLYIAIALIIFGSIFYFVEDTTNIPSIPDAFWLSLITMTTVGYGDMYPKTGLGKLTGGFCALTGMLLLSLIIPVFVGTFISVYGYANYSKISDVTVKGNKKRSQSSSVHPNVFGDLNTPSKIIDQ